MFWVETRKLKCFFLGGGGGGGRGEQKETSPLLDRTLPSIRLFIYTKSNCQVPGMDLGGSFGLLILHSSP